MPIWNDLDRDDFEEPDNIARPVVTYGAILTLKESIELDFHRHRKAQLVLALRGVLTCEAEGGMWIVPPGRALWVPGGMMHRITASGTIEAYMAIIEPDLLPGLSTACCTVSVTPLLRELLMRAASFPVRYPTGGTESRLVTLLIDEIAAAPVESLHLPMPRDPRLRRIFEWMMADPASPSTIEDWAARVALSARTLARLVLRQTGMSFGRWRQQLQVILAIQRMAAGASVQAVAFELGYESAGSFVTMFRKALGTPPARFMSERREAIVSAPGG